MNKQPSQAGKTPGSPDGSGTASDPQKASSPSPSQSAAESSKALHIPPLLLEGDDPPAVTAADPPKFAVAPAPTPPPASGASESFASELPESYGTGHLMLWPRDPYCLYAHWDLSAAQQQAYCAQSSDQRLVLRVGSGSAPPTEISLPAGSNSRFVAVLNPASAYTAELGYYRHGEWTRVAMSDTAVTPPASASSDKSVRFAEPENIGTPESPAAIPIPPPKVQWIPALEEAGAPAADEAAVALPAPSEWSSEQECALAEMLGPHRVSLPSPSSLELTEWIRREIDRSIAAVQFGQSLPESVASPLGVEPPRLQAFWFNVNAELIVYGATDPTAQVTIAGQPISLRPDGTFSCRFALPDGEFELEVAATSVLQEQRQAKLKFRRQSEYSEPTGSLAGQPPA